MSAWLNRSLIGIKGLSEQDIREVLDRARELKKLWRGWRGTEFPHQAMRGKTLVNLFFEASTRTRSSFELAARRLGAHVLNLTPEASSVSKGETLFDTARNLEAMDPDVLVLRHASAGAPFQLSEILKIPIINAGDGFHEHPTQALLDVFTMEEAKGSLKGLNVLIVGDIAHSRVARSNIYALQTLGANVSVCGPPTLIPPAIQRFNDQASPKGAPRSNDQASPKGASRKEVSVVHDLRKGIRDADVVMMLRIQMERQNQMQFPSLREYSRFWGLNADTVGELKEGAIIMHPGPLNEGVEISQEIASGPYSVILNQVNNGVIIRMALMDLIVGGVERRRA